MNYNYLGIYVYLKQKGIAEKKPIESVYSYEQFVDNFEEGWKHKFMSSKWYTFFNVHIYV